jgi:hypothetical protein
VKMKHPVKIVVMNSFNHSYSSIFVASLQRLKIPAELVVIPYFMPNELSPVRVRSVQELLNPTWPGQQVIYCPGVMELFLSGAHHSLHFSGYRDWHNPEDVTVLPHPWSIHANRERAKLEWDVKPALSASFMGSVYADATMVRLARRLSKPVHHWLLKGRYLKHALIMSSAFAIGLPMRFMLAFPRAESLDALTAQSADQPGFSLDVVDTRGFTGRDDSKARYVSSMLATTYAICPRGSENFSFRAYEALQFGRVPVIIDTDMILPKSIPWRDVALIIPYSNLDKIADIIRDDHASRDANSFAQRQDLALSTMDALANEIWLNDELLRITSTFRAQ